MWGTAHCLIFATSKLNCTYGAESSEAWVTAFRSAAVAVLPSLRLSRLHMASQHPSVSPRTPRKQAQRRAGRVVAAAARIYRGLGGHEFLQLSVRDGVVEVSQSPSSAEVLRTTTTEEELGGGVDGDWLLSAAAAFWALPPSGLVLVAGDEVVRGDMFTEAETLYVVHSPVAAPLPCRTPTAPRRKRHCGGEVLASDALVRRGRCGGEVLLQLAVRGPLAELKCPASGRTVAATTIGEENLGVSGAWLLDVVAEFFFERLGSARLVLFAGASMLQDGEYTSEKELYVEEISHALPPYPCLSF